MKIGKRSAFDYWTSENMFFQLDSGLMLTTKN